MQVRSLGWGDSLEEVMATHSSILAWRIPWTGESGGLRSKRSLRVRHDWSNLACMHVLYLVAQSCLSLCDPMDCSPPCSSVHGILQARILEKVAMPSSRGSSQDQTMVSCIAGGFFMVWATREACMRSWFKGYVRFQAYNIVIQDFCKLYSI